MSCSHINVVKVTGGKYSCTDCGEKVNIHAVSTKDKPVIMEVIGAGGQKVAEYCDTGKDELPYQEVVERGFV